MKLLAFSCTNIWPFLDRTVSVSFLDGKHLIKAPIGSGKSFLFFDGPVFALYKYSSRPMLSMKAESWQAKILFEENGQIMICVRDITRSKSGNDTVKSSLFTLENDLNHVASFLKSTSVLTRDSDLVDTVLKSSFSTRMDAKNEGDVQGNLDGFIPPQEVFLSTSMLLQDSENVFELAPAERISLLKEVFGLISIDSATDTINDERKAVWALLKSKAVSDDVDKKLQMYLWELYSYTDAISDSENLLCDLKQELSMIKDKVGIKEFSLDTQRTYTIQMMQTSATENYNAAQKALWAVESQQDTLRSLEKELSDTTEQRQKTVTELEKLQKNNEQDDKTIIDEHTAKKTNLQAEYDTRLEQLPEKWFSSWERSFLRLRDAAQDHIQQGKSLIEQQIFSQKTLAQLEQKALDDKQTLETYDGQIANLQKDYDSKKKFACEKIWGEDCPFIEQINTWFFNTFKKNIESVQATRTSFQAKLADTNTHEKIEEEKKKLQELEANINTMKQSFYYTDYKLITAQKTVFDQLTQQLQNIQNADRELAKKIQEQQEKAIKIVQHEEKKKNLTESIKILENKIESAKKMVDTPTMNTLSDTLKNTQILLTTLAKIQQYIDRINDLVAQHKDEQWAIKKLEEREKLLTDLYRIFSKEIMIKVLEDALPFFAEYINNLLAKMVDFTIHFLPKKTATDKLELEISIRDGHGERPAKSLSWWQKAILRLSWILAVAQLTGVKQLLLDETINNIDRETISQVAEMLWDYAKTNEIALYLVTHSEQLQWMDIWDSEISL